MAERDDTAVTGADHDKKMSVVGHLAELRMRLLIVFVSLIAGTVIGWYGVDGVLQLFRERVGTLVFYSPAEAFTTRIRIALTLGAVITLPVLLSQIWLFVMPALFPHERKLVVRYVPIAFVLFVAGVMLGFFVNYPLAVRFLLQTAGEARPAISVAEHFTFFTAMLVPPGLALQVPLLMHAAGRLGLVSPLVFQRRRRHAFFWSAVIAAYLAPDVISLFLLTLPLFLLFEAGIHLARRAAAARGQEQRRGATEGGETR